MPDPITVLHKIAAGQKFHAPVALHSQALYFAAPLAGMLLFLALTAAFTMTPLDAPGYERGGYFTADNPYGFSAAAQPAGGATAPAGHPGQTGYPGQSGQSGYSGNPGYSGPTGQSGYPGQSGQPAAGPGPMSPGQEPEPPTMATGG